MPLDNTLTQDWGLNRAAYWALKFCWWPQTCFLTGKKLWGRYAYHGENWITGPGDPVVQYYWIERNEFLIWQIKKDH
jgi:hypothetical protein